MTTRVPSSTERRLLWLILACLTILISYFVIGGVNRIYFFPEILEPPLLVDNGEQNGSFTGGVGDDVSLDRDTNNNYGNNNAPSTHTLDTTKTISSNPPTNKKSDINNDEIVCIDDRLENKRRLGRNEFICSHRNNYRLGMTAYGDFIYIHANKEKNHNEPSVTTTLFHNPNRGTGAANQNNNKQDNNDGDDDSYFVLQPDGRFQVWQTVTGGDDDILLWNVDCKREVHWSEKCLPKYNCPYLHIHSDGVVVLNFIDSEGWNELQIRGLYGFSLYQPTLAIAATAGEKSEYRCKGVRLENKTPLNRGEFICSRKNNYNLGMTWSGDLIYVHANAAKKHDESSVTTVLYQNNENSKDSFFVLQPNGRMEVWARTPHDDDILQWSKDCRSDVHWTKRCLPDFNCPYLHIHSDGVVVLNFIDGNDEWNEKQIRGEYGLKLNT